MLVTAKISTERERQADRLRERCGRERETKRERERQREMKRDKERQRETKRNKERQRDTKRAIECACERERERS